MKKNTMTWTSKPGAAAALVLAILALQAGCGKQAPAGAASAVPAAKAASKLGDLAPFRAIAQDVARKAGGGDLAGARLRIKDLEVAWDEAEAGLKPRSAADWHIVDGALDRALAALRAEPPDAADCKRQLDQLLKAFDATGAAN
jgi:hypothetical protein